MINKSQSAFRTIADVAEEIGVAPHVLRFWETKFSQISPMKARGGRRYYRPDDVALIKLIRNFLYEKRYTIEGVQKLFKQKGVKAFLSGDIQKDFFDTDPQEQPMENTKIVEISQLSKTQIENLTSAKNELLDLKDTLSRFV